MCTLCILFRIATDIGLDNLPSLRGVWSRFTEPSRSRTDDDCRSDEQVVPEPKWRGRVRRGREEPSDVEPVRGRLPLLGRIGDSPVGFRNPVRRRIGDPDDPLEQRARCCSFSSRLCGSSRKFCLNSPFSSGNSRWSGRRSRQLRDRRNRPGRCDRHDMAESGASSVSASVKHRERGHVDVFARRPGAAFTLNSMIKRIALDGNPAGLLDQAADLGNGRFLAAFGAAS